MHAVTFAAYGGLWVTAPWVVPWYLGPEFEVSVTPRRIMLVGLAFAAIVSTTNSVLMAKGREWLVAWTSLAVGFLTLGLRVRWGDRLWCERSRRWHCDCLRLPGGGAHLVRAPSVRVGGGGVHMRIAVVHAHYSGRVPSGENIVVAEQTHVLRSGGHRVLLLRRHQEVAEQRPGYAIQAGLTAATGIGPSPERILNDFAPTSFTSTTCSPTSESDGCAGGPARWS